MALEANLKSKVLYKIQIYMLKVIPMVMAFCYLLNNIFSYFDKDLCFLSYLSGCSLSMIAYLYISSYTFRFCEYHRMFLHYIVINTLISIYDLYIGISVNDLELLVIYLSIAGIALFIILYLYVKNNKRPIIEDSEGY